MTNEAADVSNRYTGALTLIQHQFPKFILLLDKFILVERGKYWDFRFWQFLRSVFRFLCQKKLPLFGFGDYCGFCSIWLSVFGFLICYSMQFGVFFGSPLGKYAPLTTSTDVVRPKQKISLFNTTQILAK